MRYEVQTVDAAELPTGHDMVIVERGPQLPAVMLLTGRPAQAFRAMRAWEDTQEPCVIPTMLYAAS